MRFRRKRRHPPGDLLCPSAIHLVKEDKASWVEFFQWLKNRGLDGVKLIVGDKCMGMLEAVGEVYPMAKYN